MVEVAGLIYLIALVLAFALFVALLQAVQKFAKILTKHLERQHLQGQQTLIALEACRNELQDIKESLFFANNRQ